MKRTLNSFSYAWNGLRTVWKEEMNFKIEVTIAAIVLFAIFYFDFTPVESIMCIIAIGLVLASEIINTAVEDLCNRIEPNQDPLIGKVKDTMAAFVFVTALSALIVGIIVFYSHFT